MMTRQGFCIYGKLLVSMRYFCVYFISMFRIVVYFAAGRFVYLPNPEPSDISIWPQVW